jgi:hypothetical protein
MIVFGRRTGQASRLQALRELYRSLVSENAPEAKGHRLMRQWLTPAQRGQFDELGYFDVVGCSTGRRYRIEYGSSANVQEIGSDGKPRVGWCFVPSGHLVPGDVMLAQKIALETDELAALAVANPLPPVPGGRRGIRRSP